MGIFTVPSLFSWFGPLTCLVQKWPKTPLECMHGVSVYVCCWRLGAFHLCSSSASHHDIKWPKKLASMISVQKARVSFNYGYLLLLQQFYNYIKINYLKDIARDWNQFAQLGQKTPAIIFSYWSVIEKWHERASPWIPTSLALFLWHSNNNPYQLVINVPQLITFQQRSPQQ